MRVGVPVCASFRAFAPGPTLLCDGVSGAEYKIRLDHVLVIEMTTKVTHVVLYGISIPPPVISGEMPGG